MQYDAPDTGSLVAVVVLNRLLHTFGEGFLKVSFHPPRYLGWTCIFVGAFDRT